MIKNTSSKIITAVSLAIAASVLPTASAVDYTWNIPTNTATSWTTTTAWTPTAGVGGPQAGDNIVGNTATNNNITTNLTGGDFAVTNLTKTVLGNGNNWSFNNTTAAASTLTVSGTLTDKTNGGFNFGATGAGTYDVTVAALVSGNNGSSADNFGTTTNSIRNLAVGSTDISRAMNINATGTASLGAVTIGAPNGKLTLAATGATGATRTVQAASLTGASGAVVQATGNATTATVATLQLTGTTGSTTYGGTLINGGAAATLALSKTGASTQILTGVNTYSGATTISAGTLQLGDGTTGKDGTIANTSGITNNGKLIYNRFGNLSSDRVIGGTGAVTISGTGSQTLTAVNTYGGLTTINSGATLQLGDGTTGKDGTIANTSGITNNGTLIYNRFGSVSSDRVISGNGAVTKLGGGTQTLTGNNTFTGATTISGGTLSASGTGALGQGTTGTASVTVNTGGTLLLANSAVTDRVKNTAGVTLNAGAIAAATGSHEGTAATKTGTVTGTSLVGMGTLTLSATSTLDFDSTGDSTLMVFSGFSNSGAFTLNITGYNNTHFNGTTNSGLSGDDRLVFNSSLTSMQLSQINFGAGKTTKQLLLDTGFYEIGFTAVPEPSTWVGAAALVGLAGFGGLKQRKRLRGLFC